MAEKRGETVKLIYDFNTAGHVDVPMRTYDYWGPVYMFGTNKEMTYTNSGSMYTGKVWDANRKISESRG